MKLEINLKGSRDFYTGYPSCKFINRKYKLLKDQKFVDKTFAAGEIIEFKGVRVTEFNKLSFFEYPDSTLRHAMLDEIKLLRK